jgi:hypothetical protein
MFAFVKNLFNGNKEKEDIPDEDFINLKQIKL